MLDIRKGADDDDDMRSDEFWYKHKEMRKEKPEVFSSCGEFGIFTPLGWSDPWLSAGDRTTSWKT